MDSAQRMNSFWSAVLVPGSVWIFRGAGHQQWYRSCLPRRIPGSAYAVRPAFLQAFTFPEEFLNCLPELAVLIKQLFLGDIVYVCWSQRGVCRHYFYLRKVNSEPESEMPLVSFHCKAPRTDPGPFWMSTRSCDKVRGKKLEGMSGHAKEGEISGSLRHEEQRGKPLVSGPLSRAQGPSVYKGEVCLLMTHHSPTSKAFYSAKGQDDTEFRDWAFSNKVQRILVPSLHCFPVPNLTKLYG